MSGGSSIFRATLRCVGVFVLGTAVLGAAGCAHPRTSPPQTAIPPTKPERELGAETGVPMSSTPRGLMHDGAQKKIQDRLRARQLLAADQCTGEFNVQTRDALRAFQKREGLPATGLPSYETVEHLGLELDTIFRSAQHAEAPPRREASPR